VWLACTLAFILALPALGSSVAFAAATSIATIGLYISYAIPIAILAFDHSRFLEMRGPFNLGRASLPVAYVAMVSLIISSFSNRADLLFAEQGWVTFITIAFCLPTANPVGECRGAALIHRLTLLIGQVDSQTLNYTVVAVGIVALGTFGSWFLWARKWFVGPRQGVFYRLLRLWPLVYLFCQTTAALEEASKEPGAVVGRISTDEKSDGKESPESPVVQRVITGNE
jgi:amino acid transporter